MFVQARNYHPGRIKKIRLIVVHTAESLEVQGSAHGTAVYFAGQPKGGGGSSAHACVDSREAVDCVRDEDTAWAAPGVNADGLHVEHAGRAGQGAAGWADAYSRATLAVSAKRTAIWVREHGIPIRHLSDAELAAGKAGFIGHVQASRVYKKSDHTDPGPDFPWAEYLALVSAAVAALGGRPWTRGYAARVAAALGVSAAVFAGITLAPDPAPSPVRPPAATTSSALPRPAVSPPAARPKATPTPAPKPTAKLAPKPGVLLAYGATGADVRALQRRLGITADGSYGRRTVRAVAAFQRKYHLTVDGVAGPVTLDRLHLHLT